jgi:RNA polymerase sigma factor (sigma-70 family)
MEATALPRAHGRARSAGLLRFAGDERLVELVRRGDESAFEALYDRHHRPILSFCRHMLASADEAEDAVQHTFLSAYRDLTASDKPIDLRPWLFAIARNRCFSMLRQRREHASVDDLEPATEGLASEVQRREDLRQLLGDLRRLPDDQREALVLAELGALGHDHIADVIGCPKEKVKALVFQARSSLSASREARETPCAQIREELATRRGGALRRSHLRRHLRDCPGCRHFRSEVERQRKAMALLLPVAPTAALKQTVLAGTLGGSAAAGAAGGSGLLAGGLGALATKGAAAKAVAIIAIAGAGTAGGVAVVDEIQERNADDKGRPVRAVPGVTGSGGLDPQTAPAGRGNGAAPATTPPGTPGSGGNRDAAHRLARSRGNGRKRGLEGTQPGQSGGARGNSESSPGHNRPAGGGGSGGQGNAGAGPPSALPEQAAPEVPPAARPLVPPGRVNAEAAPGRPTP